MPRVTINTTNFTAGEITPRMRGRTDVDRYNNAARTLVNAYPVIHGGARRRPGTRYVAATKTGAKKTRLIPFVHSRDLAYMLEFGDLYVRIYSAGGAYTGVELATVYTEAMLADIDFAQGADTMFIAHPTVPIQRLRRFSATVFDLSPAPFTTEPFDEQGHALAASITLSAATAGTGRTVTASAGVFLPGDVGRALQCGAGLATITSYSSPTVLGATITIPFAGTALASGTWFLDASPFAFLKASAKDPVNTMMTLASAISRGATLTLAAKTGLGITVTASVGVFTAGDVGSNIYADSGTANIIGFTSTTQVTVDIGEDFAALSYVSGGWAVSNAAWRPEDVGKFVRINGGLCKVVGFINGAAVNAQIVTVLESTVVSPPQGWILESSMWSAVNGYPRSITLHEQRLITAGNLRFPQTIWGSRTGEYLDYTKGDADADAYIFTLATDEVNPISYVASVRNLVVHTYGGEFSMQGGVEKPITPTNVRVRTESSHGSRGVRPVTVGNESIFVQRAGRKVRSLGYRVDADAYTSPDLTVMAEHITEPGTITALAYQQEPDLLLWAVRSDGALMSCTLDREQSVVGWAPGHYTDGWFESVASIPNGDRDEVWVVVRRVVNGATVRYLEVLDDTFAPIYPAAASTAPPPGDAPVVYGYTVDSGLAFDNAAGQTVFNVPHLVGKTVDIVADGAVQLAQEVDGAGNVTLTRSSKRTLIGLHFRSEVGLLTPEMGTGTGSSQGNSMRTSEVTMRFLNTIGARVLDGEGNEQEVPWRRFGPDVLDKPPQPYSGNVRVETLGWERGRSEFTIVQEQPMPMHLLSVARKHQVND